MALSGLTVSAIGELLGETDTRLWRAIRACVARACAHADYSDVRAVGVDETAKKRGHDYLSAFVDLDARRVVSVQEGRDAGTVAGFADDLAAHGGDAEAVEAVTCDYPFVRERHRRPHAAGRPHSRPLPCDPAVHQAVDKVRAAEAREPRASGIS